MTGEPVTFAALSGVLFGSPVMAHLCRSANVTGRSLPVHPDKMKFAIFRALDRVVLPRYACPSAVWIISKVSSEQDGAANDAGASRLQSGFSVGVIADLYR